MSRPARVPLGLAIGACLLIACADRDDRRPRLLFNTTASAPVGFYWVDGAKPKVGDLVVVRPPQPLAWWLAQRGYLPVNVPLLKTLAAMAGSRVCGARGVIAIDGQVVGQARARDHGGRRLPAFEGCRTLAEDEIFLFNAAAPASLDSRYFGPLRRRDMVGRVRPLWIWERGA